MALREIPDLWAAHHSPVVIDQLADCRHRLDAGEAAEVDRRLGMTRAHQHPAILANQREDMTRPDEIRPARIIVCEVAYRRRAVLGGDPGCGTVAVIDRYRKGGAVNRIVVRDHRRKMQTPRSLRSQWRADDPAGIADDEGHLVWRRMEGSADQVGLVIAVIIISDDDYP